MLINLWVLLLLIGGLSDHSPKMVPDGVYESGAFKVTLSSVLHKGVLTIDDSCEIYGDFTAVKKNVYTLQATKRRGKTCPTMRAYTVTALKPMPEEKLDAKARKAKQAIQEILQDRNRVPPPIAKDLVVARTIRISRDAEAGNAEKGEAGIDDSSVKRIVEDYTIFPGDYMRKSDFDVFSTYHSYKAGNYYQVLITSQLFAKVDNDIAWTMLARLSRYGLGLARDDAKALELYNKAEAQGAEVTKEIASLKKCYSNKQANDSLKKQYEAKYKKYKRVTAWLERNRNRINRHSHSDVDNWNRHVSRQRSLGSKVSNLLKKQKKLLSKQFEVCI